MEIVYFSFIVFLFMLAVFDLVVGVSNDAVNFLNSAIGAKVARFRTILIIASIGVFVGATMSNGMMDIARHGIFQPQMFSFNDLLCIFLAVMVTDVVLLDVFNTLGMPTSTTVSMVFELLGGTFILSLLKIATDETGLLGFADLLNTDKALSVILGIFLSVAVAFIFGTVVQWLSRLIFTFNYTSKLKWKIGLFGGIATTCILYFALLKGLKDSSFMTPEYNAWITDDDITPKKMSESFRGVGDYAERLNFLKTHIETGEITREKVYSESELKADSSKVCVQVLEYRKRESNKVAIIIPGGGYSNVCSFSEGWPIAQELFERGYNCFVLYYRVFPNAYMPNPIEDVARLVKRIKENYPDLDLNGYLMLGF